MVAGDPGVWAARFRTLDERFLERVVAVWPSCVAVLPDDPPEDTITENLVAKILEDAPARRLFHYLEYHYEPFGYTPEGRVFSKARSTWPCCWTKTATAISPMSASASTCPGTVASARWRPSYVTDGLRRFVTEKYAAGLPVGCMLGYVLDGDAPAAHTKVLAAIRARRDDIRLRGEPTRQLSIGPASRLLTRHEREPTSPEIEVRHALLPFPS